MSSQHLEQELRTLVAELTDRDTSALDLEDHLASELGLDSLDTLELLAEVEMRFNVHLPEDRLAEFCTMQRLLDAIRQSERCEHA